MAFEIGESVKVKAGVKSPDDASLSIAGWQGRIIEIGEDKETIGIRWDSITLSEMSPQYFKESEIEGLGWAEMYLDVGDVEPAPPRDTEAEAETAREELFSKYRWFDGDEEGERIFAVIAGVDEDDELDAWVGHLSRTLTFPFDATVSEYEERAPLKQGEKVRVQGLDEADEEYGVLVRVNRGRERFVFPLCDLNVVDGENPNYLPVTDYCFWFANR
ncbi:MAG: calcium-binding protein [Candidatus Krumholzibacteriia bacterium]